MTDQHIPDDLSIKPVFTRLKPSMTREQIKRNLIDALQKSGFTIHPSPKHPEETKSATTCEPKTPMSPDELPQQRVHEVVTLPPRPIPFDCTVGYGKFPKGSIPSGTPRNMTYLAQVEWAWSPMHNRLNAYYLHRGRTYWSLWSRSWDDNWGEWSDIPIGCVPRRGVSEQQAAVYLLLEYWREEVSESQLDEFHWVNEEDYLSDSDLTAIAREVW